MVCSIIITSSCARVHFQGCGVHAQWAEQRAFLKLHAQWAEQRAFLKLHAQWAEQRAFLKLDEKA